MERPEQRPSMKNRWLWSLMAVSIVANALLIGYIVGHNSHRPLMAAFNRRMPPPPMQRPDEATRAIMKESFAAERPAMNEAFGAMAAARRQAVVLLKAETLDTAALDEQLKTIRERSLEATVSFHRAIRDSATKLTSPQRAVLARMLERAPMRDGRGGVGGMGSMMGDKDGPPRKDGPSRRDDPSREPPPGPPPGSPAAPPP
jgi:uncharacterized membrane protein